MKILERARAPLPTKHGQFTIYSYKFSDGKTHTALIRGEEKENILARIHSQCLTSDVFGSSRCDCGMQLAKTFEQIEQEKSGIIIYLDQEGRDIGLHNKIKAYTLQDEGLDTVEANEKLGFRADERSYEAAGLILRDLGITSIRLLTNNPHKIAAMESAKIRVERVPLIVDCGNHHYLATKKKKMEHLL